MPHALIVRTRLALAGSMGSARARTRHTARVCARKVFSRLSLVALLATALLGCTRAHTRPPVGLCPPLVVGEGERTTTYTGVVSFEDFAPSACVDVLMGGVSLGRTFVNHEGMFALQLAIRGDVRGQRALVRVENADGTVRRIDIQIPDTPTQAEISYEPDTTPLIVSGDELVFEGVLARTAQTEAPIRDVAIVSWGSSRSGDVMPTPALDTPFRASIRASAPACGTVLSWHGGNLWGGCWWPDGAHFGCTGGCTQQDYELGQCVMAPPCPAGRGCTPIQPDEPARPPPPQRDDSIPTAPPEALPPDAGFDAFGDAWVS